MSIFSKFKAFFSGRKGLDKPSERKKFIALWTNELAAAPEVFTGLYNGLLDVSNGKLKRQATLFKEWSERVDNRLDSDAKASSVKYIVPMIGSSEPEKVSTLAGALLEAAAAAGIIYEQGSEVVINETNLDHYTPMSSDEALSAGDVVTVIKPAWYFSGRVIENGFADLK
ncbi:MAG: hypothetical protein IKO47_05145 [Ruminococcus sp.]|nr:hypothetical protein [Ruminococcus sp.]